MVGMCEAVSDRKGDRQRENERERDRGGGL